jgi:hypothetical protein
MIEDFDLQIFAYCPVMRSSEKKPAVVCNISSLWLEKGYVG